MRYGGRCRWLSQERILKLLETFGLAKTDAEVYIYLAKKGPRREIDLSKAFKLTDTKLDFILENLKSKGLVTATHTQFELFSAMPFEVVLDQLVKFHIQRGSAIIKNREAFLARWRSSIQKKGE